MPKKIEKNEDVKNRKEVKRFFFDVSQNVKPDKFYHTVLMMFKNRKFCS
jgi:hypothetical protein